MRICIIGGGASGMAAAIVAAKALKDRKENNEIIILEKKEKLGSKLLATGNGRCNITNSQCSGVLNALNFFEEIGVIVREEEQGRMYPVSGKAQDVCEAMVRQLVTFGVKIKCNCVVNSIENANHEKNVNTDKNDNSKNDKDKNNEIKYVVKYTNDKGAEDSLLADRVIIASGGKASPQHGTSGDGYAWAKSLGHSISRLSPVLTDLKTAECEQATKTKNSFKGIRARGNAALYLKDQLVSMEPGEIQLTDEGLSGICIFNLSRFVVLGEDIAFNDYTVGIDFLPELELAETIEMLGKRKNIAGFKAKDILSSIVDKKISFDILKRSNINEDMEADMLLESDITEIAQHLKNYRFTVSGAGGWKSAQCTRGGVELSFVDETTMESKCAKGIYFAGEILDYDGPCGGYNLQYAWETGIKAGKALVGEI